MSKKSRRAKKASVTSPVAVTSSYQPIMVHHWGVRPRDLPLFTFLSVQAMLYDPTIRLGLAMRAAPVYQTEFGYKGDDGQWTPGVQCKNEAVGAFVYRQLQRIWNQDIAALVKSQIWGHAAGEVMLKLSPDNMVEVDRLLERHAVDCKILKQRGQGVGIRVARLNYANEGKADLFFNRAKAYFTTYNLEAGAFYGTSILLGAYSPWFDKWCDGGALDVRRLYMHKDAYQGCSVRYPEGEPQEIDMGNGEIQFQPARDLARQMAEQIMAGGVTCLPSGTDEKGNKKWELVPATVSSNPGHILKYPQDLDTEMLRGMEVPDDIFTSTERSPGDWGGGKKVPLAAFYAGIDVWVTQLIKDLRRCLFDPLVLLNFGKAEDYDIGHKPLAEQAMDQQKGQQQPPQGPQQIPGQPPGMPGQPGPGGPEEGGEPGGQGGGGLADLFGSPEADAARGGGPPQAMSLEAAIGRGVLDAAEIVKASRETVDAAMVRMAADGPEDIQAIRMRLYGLRAPKGGISIQGKKFTGGEFIPNEDIDKASEEELAQIRGTKAHADTSIGRAVPTKREGKGKEAKLTPAEGELPKHITPAMVPPAWKDVLVNQDEEADVWVSAKDAKGNVKRIYNPSFEHLTTVQKFARVTSMAHEADAIDSQIQAARSDPKTAEEADCAWLMSLQGTRPGSDEDARGLGHLFGVKMSPENVVVKEGKRGQRSVSLNINGQAVPVKSPKTQAEILRRLDADEDLEDSDFWLNSTGATTLQARHVRIGRDGVFLNFVGKEGVWHDHLIRDKALARMLVEREGKAKSPTDKLFDTTDGRVSRFTKTLGSGKYSPKDFRTKRANELAVEHINRLPAPKTQEELAARMLDVGHFVSGVLGNEAAQALGTYINPLVFRGWQDGIERQQRQAA